MTEDAALLSCCGLRKTFGKDAGLVRAVDGVDLDVAAGETVAIMGAERLREVDPAASAGRAGPAVWRGGSAGREPGGPDERAGPGPAAPGFRRVRLPGFPPDGRAHRGG